MTLSATKTTVVNGVYQDYDVYIGRPSKWGNPFTHKADLVKKNPKLILVGSVEEAVESYHKWIVKQPLLLADLHQLKGKRLGCWCKPGCCHGDVLAELADV